jgi:hypothetical protein
MPRKTDTHFNEQSEALPTDVVEECSLPSGIEALLPIGLSAEMSSSVLRDIRYALAEYAWEFEAGPYRYTRAEASAALRDLLKAGAFDHETVIAINQRAFNLLYDCLDDHGAQQWMLFGSDAEPPVTAIELAARRAISLNDSQRGPEQSMPLAILVARLCHVYEAANGKSVTHHNKTKELAYTQRAQTDAGQFVTAIIHIAFRDTPVTLVNRHLRSFVANRPEPF